MLDVCAHSKIDDDNAEAVHVTIFITSEQLEIKPPTKPEEEVVVLLLLHGNDVTNHSKDQRTQTFLDYGSKKYSRMNGYKISARSNIDLLPVVVPINLFHARGH